VYCHHLLRGTSLPPRMLCLTFDDGPAEPARGSRSGTLALARYLKRQGIQATFFVVGRHAERLPQVVSQLAALGHLPANHTHDHADLRRYLQAGAALAEQITQTDRCLRPWLRGRAIYVRPPYGSWSKRIAQLLNADHQARAGHVGPVGWDIDGQDWNHWQQGRSPRECADHYLDQIAARGRGIVLMHDGTTDVSGFPQPNRTYEMVRLLVPALLQAGYRFVRLDQVLPVR
jgi:peptidoglycan/xylan/chitin deacetylase (PgdA/CDA1 family)